MSSNPISYFDPLGLTRQDVVEMLCFARMNKNFASSFGPDYESLDIPYVGDITFTNLFGKQLGGTTFWRDIELDNSYLGRLSPEGRVDLFNTIIHEASHLKQPWGLEKLFEGISHAIGDEAERRFGKQILNGNIGHCSCTREL